MLPESLAPSLGDFEAFSCSFVSSASSSLAPDSDPEGEPGAESDPDLALPPVSELLDDAEPDLAGELEADFEPAGEAGADPEWAGEPGADPEPAGEAGAVPEPVGEPEADPGLIGEPGADPDPVGEPGPDPDFPGEPGADPDSADESDSDPDDEPDPESDPEGDWGAAGELSFFGEDVALSGKSVIYFHFESNHITSISMNQKSFSQYDRVLNRTRQTNSIMNPFQRITSMSLNNSFVTVSYFTDLSQNQIHFQKVHHRCQPSFKP